VPILQGMPIGQFLVPSWGQPVDPLQCPMPGALEDLATSQVVQLTAAVQMVDPKDGHQLRRWATGFKGRAPVKRLEKR
jgi:hypothetical protein